jgi:hypothetical protein
MTRKTSTRKTQSSKTPSQPVPPDPDRARRLTRPNLTPEQQAEWRKTADPEMERAFGFA